jgi:aspartokinase
VLLFRRQWNKLPDKLSHHISSKIGERQKWLSVKFAHLGRNNKSLEQTYMPENNEQAVAASAATGGEQRTYKVMKFGGTSVGKPHRMHEVANLITKDKEPKLVVLSAVSGTTNSLVEIGNFLSIGNKEEAKAKIDALEAQYQTFIKELVTTPEALQKAGDVLKEHFEFLNIILRISYNEALNKDILAQGELLSTKLFSIYLAEKGVDHALLPALDFMSIDANDEPQVEVIREKLLHKDTSAAMPGEKWTT